MKVFPDYTIADGELRYLTFAIERKQESIEGLRLAAETRKARGGDDLPILESIDGELAILSGYQRAVDRRKRELDGGAK